MIHVSRLVSPYVFIFMGLLASGVLANEPTPKTAPCLEHTHIHFQSSAQEKVTGDTMQATLRLEVKNRQPAVAAKDLNQRLQDSMQSLRADKALHLQTSQYSTQQIFDEKGRPKDWQVSVELTISSEQWNKLSEHIASLQNKGWLFSNVNFEVSSEQRKAAEKRLVQRALAEWNEQGELVAKQLQLKKWHIGDLDISHEDAQPPRFKPFVHARAMMASAEAAPAPDMAGADTTVNVTVSGELIAD